MSRLRQQPGLSLLRRVHPLSHRQDVSQHSSPHASLAGAATGARPCVTRLTPRTPRTKSGGAGVAVAPQLTAHRSPGAVPIAVGKSRAAPSSSRRRRRPPGAPAKLRDRPMSRRSSGSGALKATAPTATPAAASRATTGTRHHRRGRRGPAARQTPGHSRQRRPRRTIQGFGAGPLPSLPGAHAIATATTRGVGTGGGAQSRPLG